MSKADFHALFDKALYDSFVSVVGKGNVKSALEDYMGRYAQGKDDAASGIKMSILKADIKELNKRVSELMGELNSKQEALDQLIATREQKKRVELEEEHARLEKLKKCINCSRSIEENIKKHQFKLGFVCNACFLACGAKMVRKWNDTGDENGKSD